MKPADIRQKAEIAISSAKALLALGDTDGASNRAYYAMFDIARAALMEINAPLSMRAAKTHKGLISAFSLYLVKPGILTPQLGQALSRAFEIRIWADYTGDAVSFEYAETLVGDASIFLEEVAKRVF